MYLVINKIAELISCSNLNNPQIFKISNHEIVNKPINNPVYELFEKGLYQFDRPYFRLENNSLKYIVVPACYSGEVYFVEKGDQIILSDNFFEICASLKVVSKDIESFGFFMNKGYFPPGKTWFKEIGRLLPRNIYKIDNHNITGNYINDSENFEGLSDHEKYQIFKKRLNSAILYNSSSEQKHGVMLSGGVDSRLIALILGANNQEINTYTIKQSPISIGNLLDVKLAAQFSNDIGVTHNVPELNFKNLELNELDYIISEMPLTVHISLNFLALGSAMKNDGIVNSWCGQNLDNLYNLGPTGKLDFSIPGMTSLFRRYFLSDMYISALDKVEGGFLVNTLIQKAIGVSGAKLYSTLKRTGYKPPKDVYEFIQNFNTSYDNTIFTNLDKKSIQGDIKDSSITLQSVRNELFKQKVEGYLSSGESEVVFQTNMKNNLTTILPYSSEIMIPILRSLRTTIKDVLKPKRFMYKYTNEFSTVYGKSVMDFNLRTENELTKEHNQNYDAHYAANQILNTTVFGRQLKEINKDTIKHKSFTNVQYLRINLINYWKHKIWSTLNELNVEIRE
ncbi:hypothetical protein HNQ94_003032 [Salirhabdus euzebyi]|uniref:asparagine synthase (glutamine-hydrolyzing) n=1 Tax=Salirhabdus euzebyi TaxID=394506 RepID=A0A841Q886_9BACI|nr:asparagine synthase-related protein [Salirhabdus euzebyi]MBB6454543.1 hypothetical protein [Salirhabdus euzebyi]